MSGTLTDYYAKIDRRRGPNMRIGVRVLSRSSYSLLQTIIDNDRPATQQQSERVFISAECRRGKHARCFSRKCGCGCGHTS